VSFYFLYEIIFAQNHNATSIDDINCAVGQSMYHFDNKKTTIAPNIEAIVVLNLVFLRKFFIIIQKENQVA